MKGKLIGAYLAISFIFGTWSYFFGPYQYHSYAYNLGIGIAWPVTVFKSDPDLDGSSDEAFGKSLQDMVNAYAMQSLQIDYALGVISLQIHAESDESVDGDQIRGMFNGDTRLLNGMFSNMWKINRLKEELKDRLDGMEFSDLMEEAEDAKEELLELAEERPAIKKSEPTPEPAPQVEQAVTETVTEAQQNVPAAEAQTGEECYEEKLLAFKNEMGEEAPVIYDMINEWRGECGLPIE
ncbi:hypothetical protein [Aquipseudomonas alcaligenes]|uniref:Uncharacterized protein n=1 Tax=Aquipseudomonas alcaligenes TaxID=43263 RepID=A0AA37CGH2_AQUAC|nr:hypothetical protein [Pseudomonas alcaligenes]BCR23427.1 hypothetical protein KAM426_09540 [Pseudomonas alcaligenes]GIZ68361.1 hypothetical protein KAM428_34460 [Pseudomonas alcaligenes]GIZ73561.1 hypothetical protein KAM429_43220 [Pseudomonas alcaligenes]GIZ77924.1 hypothetical protein KAM430_43330 [Pseudomonas alcaligenes]GIZ82237.1 hypothetical protein KAM432_42850 [Pseudomonas alcaligenes]